MELAPQIEDLAKAIESLPSLLNAISSLPISGWVVLIASILWLLANRSLPQIANLLEQRERRRIEQFDAYVSLPDTGDAATIRAIRDLRDAHYFKIATGIYAESRVRNAFIKLHEATSHLVTWRHICRAHPYLVVSSDETITVRELDFFENLSYRYNQLVAYLFLFLAASLIVIVIFSGTKSLTSVALGFGGGTLSGLFAVFVFTQNWPIHAARKIAKELESQGCSGRDT